MFCSLDRPMQNRDEKQQIGAEEAVRECDEADARQLGHQRREGWVHRDHAEQRAGEKPLEIIHAAGNAHLIANGTKNIIGRKYGEDIEPRPTERPQLRRAHVDHSFQQPVNRSAFRLQRGFSIAHESQVNH